MFKTTVNLWRITMIIAFLHQGIAYRSWENEKASYLDEGDNCETTTGDPGICTFIQECDLYYNGLIEKTIPYSSMARCSFKGFSEIICCPKTMEEGWRQLEVTTEGIHPIPPFEKEPSFQSSRQFEVTTEGLHPVPSYAEESLLQNWGHFGSVQDVEIITPKMAAKEGSSGITGTTTGYHEKIQELKRNERPAYSACRRFNPKILGVATDSLSFPHMGGIICLDNSSADYNFICGTSLISERYTLTSASCVSDGNAKPTKVRFGVNELMAPRGGARAPIDIDIEKIIPYPDYNTKFIYHDIALIRLKENVRFSEFIRPACLYLDLGDINNSLIVTSWRSKGDFPLLSVNLSTVGLLECNRSHVTQGVSRSMQNGILEGQYCTDANDGACEIIAGGPLLFVQEYLTTIVGVVLEEFQCDSQVPYVYTRVGYYLSWIEKIVWP